MGSSQHRLNFTQMPCGNLRPTGSDPGEGGAKQSAPYGTAPPPLFSSPEAKTLRMDIFHKKAATFDADKVPARVSVLVSVCVCACVCTHIKWWDPEGRKLRRLPEKRLGKKANRDSPSATEMAPPTGQTLSKSQSNSARSGAIWSELRTPKTPDP